MCSKNCIILILISEIFFRKITLQGAAAELQQVTDWRYLGENLQVPEHVLANIASDSTLTNMNARKRETLKWWLNNKDASWKHLAEALEKSDHYNLAQDIYSKYPGNSE